MFINQFVVVDTHAHTHRFSHIVAPTESVFTVTMNRSRPSNAPTTSHFPTTSVPRTTTPRSEATAARQVRRSRLFELVVFYPCDAVPSVLSILYAHLALFLMRLNKEEKLQTDPNSSPYSLDFKHGGITHIGDFGRVSLFIYPLTWWLAAVRDI